MSFRKRPLDEIVEDLDLACDAYGPGVRTIFLADGNSAALPTEELVAIGDAARHRFPQLERITMYGSAKFLVKKNRAEWERIAAAGITRIHSGLESGDPETLRQIKKGVDPEDAAEAFNHVMQAGIELSVYLMVGVAGYGASSVVAASRILTWTTRFADIWTISKTLPPASTVSPTTGRRPSSPNRNPPRVAYSSASRATP